MYFAAGAVYMTVRAAPTLHSSLLQVKHQATGTDLVVHKTCWFALPGYVKVW